MKKTFLCIAIVLQLLGLGAACGEASIVLPERFQVMPPLFPSGGAINVPYNDVLVEVRFNDVVDQTSLIGDIILLASSASEVPIEHVVSYDGRALFIVPQVVLAPNTEYTVTLGSELAGKNLGPLFADYHSRFRTAQ